MDLIVGCGYTGKRLAAALQTDAEIYGLVRSSSSAKQLQKLHIQPLIADLDQPVKLSLPTDIKRIFYFAPPPAQGMHDLRMARFLAAIEDNAPERILYISTTGVYGNCNGNWVDETRVVNPLASRAQRRHDAERQLAEFAQRTDTRIITLRVAGIYGPDKLPIARLQHKKPMVSASAAPWTNRIHSNDLVQVCIAGMNKPAHSTIFNVADGQPGKMTDYFNQVADKCGLLRPPIISPEQANQSLSAGMRSYLEESRKIDNRKMLVELEINLQCPTLKIGLEHCDL